MTKKRIVIIGGSIVGVVLLSIGFFVFRSRMTSSPIPVTATVTQTPSETLLHWEDPAGFSFSYPEGIVIDKHDEDTEHYAHIEMKQPEHPGTIIVWAKDTSFPTLAAWEKQDKTLNKATSMDTAFGKIPAKKFVIKEPYERLVAGAIEDEILFTIEAEASGSAFWKHAYDTIAASFTFTSEKNTASSEESSGESDVSEEVAADEEEVLE